MHAKSLQSCLTLCDPVDYSPPGFSVPGILQARILEWVAMPASRGSSWPRDRTCVSCDLCIAGRSFTTEPPGKPIHHPFVPFIGSYWIFSVSHLPDLQDLGIPKLLTIIIFPTDARVLCWGEAIPGILSPSCYALPLKSLSPSQGLCISGIPTRKDRPPTRNETGISLVVQWLRIHLPMQGTRVRSLLWELRSHMPQSN